ncbi:MAG: FAD-dependent monooxygenase [Burkholderiaceae bacterium]
MKIAIHGRGPVALSLALLLRRLGLRASQVALSAPRGAPSPALSARALALSGGSWQILSRIIDPPPAGAIHDVDIAFVGHGLHTRFGSSDNAGRLLGHVVRHGDLTQALERAIADWPIATLADPDDPPAPEPAAPTGRHAAASAPADDPQADVLNVHAEGRTDTVRARHSFGQRALFTEVRRTDGIDQTRRLPEHDVAYERFRTAGPLALLPLPESGHWSVVWCETPARVDELMQCTNDRFEQALAQALGVDAAHGLRLSAARHAVDLFSERADEHEARTVRIGNAAQSLHPVAGQGLNLGLRDVMSLAELLGERHAGNASVESIVREYRRVRERDRQFTRTLTDRLAMLGAGARVAPSMSQALMSGALGALDLIPPLRRQVSRHFVYGAR